MKKIVLLLLTFIFPLLAAHAQYDEDKKESLLPYTNWRMDLRIAYYHPLSREVKDVFSGSWLDYEFEVSRRMKNNETEIWVGTDLTHKKGHLGKNPSGYHNSTKASIIPISTGFKRFYRINRCLESYVGMGICYSLLRFKNHSDFHAGGLGSAPYDKYVYKNSFGGLLKVGCRYSVGKETFFDLFVDYYVTKRVKFSSSEFPKRHLNFSGIKAGLGLGVYF